MADDSGRNWKSILWQLLKPALVAAIVALLVALGVTGLRQQQLPADPGLGVLGNTTFSGPLIVRGGIQAGNNITMAGGSLISTRGGDGHG